MIWSSVATFLNLYDLILCCFWFICQHCSLPGSKIPRPRNRQDWFLTMTDQNSWQRTLQIVSFLAERISRTLPLLFEPSSKPPERRAIYSSKEKKNPWLLCFLLFGYDEQQWQRWQFNLESSTSLSSASMLSVQFCWKVEAGASQILLATTAKTYYLSRNIKSPVYCFKGLGGLRRLCYKVLLSFEHFIQDKSLKSLKVHLNYIVPAVV